VPPASRRRRVRLGAALLLALLAAGPGRALELEKLVMPGPVIAGHADVEADCGRCHAPFRREVESGLCLDCHEDVQADLKRKEGFHGRAQGLAKLPCRDCHSDHLGRDADVSGLDPHAFDHEVSDYPLRGAHRALACAACHAPGKKEREAPQGCAGCHRGDDPHRARLGEACGDCHSETSWREARFDHATTDFPLEGAHASVACALCHPSERYADTPRDCAGCHTVDDVHQGRFGARCESCHTAQDWKDTASFDHDRDTSFPLEGRHAGAACRACHVGPLDEELPADCVSCHRADDEHRGMNGTDCGSCHGADSWARSRFDHDRDTDFALRGAHQDAACATCHREPLFEADAPRTCFGCHAAADVHRGQEGEDCGRCHGEQSWREARFDHELTRFPLLGLHAGVPCEACHKTPAYQDAELDCASCHEDSFHRGRLGEKCGLCHTPNGWKVWRFDHDAATSFALHGAHEGVDCHTCHGQPVVGEIRLAGECRACHAREDVHRGAFGGSCERCHLESAWRELKPIR
jgi:hypothetical protein